MLKAVFVEDADDIQFWENWVPGCYTFRQVEDKELGVHRRILLCDPNGITVFLPLAPQWWTLVSEEPLTLTPSIWNNKGKGGDREWHGFVTNGEFVTC